MKLKQYLNEYYDDTMSADEIANILKKDCKIFLRIIDMSKGDFFLRGTEKKVDDIQTIKPRKNRKPRDMPLSVHKLLDELFKEKFGWKARSESVFAVNDIFVAEVYGSNVYLFFPIGNFKFLYSQKIPDMWNEIKDKDFGDEWENIGEFIVKGHELTKKEWEERRMVFLKSLVDKYTNKNLKGAIAVDVPEVMFKCKSYYLVNRNYEEDLKELL